MTALTDTSGAAVERYVYDPYGKVTIYDGSWSNPPRSASSYSNAILYCGYYRDGETGLYHVRNRVYNTAIGGWVQRDPLGYMDGMSVYEYCGGAPAGCIDPLGLGLMGGGIPHGVAKDIQKKANQYRNYTRDATDYSKKADEMQRKADQLEKSARAQKDPDRKKKGLNEADRLRDMSSDYRAKAQESLDAADETEIQAELLIQNAQNNYGDGGGGGDGLVGSMWYDKTWYNGNPNSDDFSWWGEYGKQVGLLAGNSVMNIGMDIANPSRVGDRVAADYAADVGRGLGGFDAGLNALAKNAPLVSAGWGLGEAIKGRTQGGVDDGRTLNTGEILGRVGGFVAAEAAAGTWAAARWNAPKPTGGGLEWRGNDQHGAWFDKQTKESFSPHLDSAEHGPHVDYTNQWR